ncbi:histidine phosphatase family protein [Dermabacteraceae bacterium TAE3-ERU27]|nr:histidine phosphatase family protein [Dermabacteraceae bacterium TAE3-ERU27]
MAKTIVHLVRHGEVHNPEKILYGRAPGFRLSERGQEMARLTAAYLAQRSVTEVTSSPLLRAQQTAAPIAAAHGLDVLQDARLLESANHFEGLRVGYGDGALWRLRHWPAYINPFRPSWGEPYRSQAERVLAAVRDARHRNEGSEAVLVLHQLPIWVTRRKLEGKPLWHDPRRRQCGLASVTSLHFNGEHFSHIEYAEPAAALYAGAVDATGGKLT